MLSSPGLLHQSHSPHGGVHPHPHPAASHPALLMGSPHHPPPPGAAGPGTAVGGGVGLLPPHSSPQQQSEKDAKDKDKESTQMSAMPLPPEQYIKLYTDEHVAMGVCPPPPPAIKDNYSMFGHPFSADDTIIQSLESQGIRRLYPVTKELDRKKELHKLNHSILINFLDLIDLLIRAPESAKREEKIDDLNLLFIHMHHLINEFRPHQARETLRVMLHVQKRKRLQVAEKFQAHLDKVEETIENALQSLPDQDDSSGKMLISTEDIEDMNASGSGFAGEAEKESCSQLDRLMCQVADDLAARAVTTDEEGGDGGGGGTMMQQ